MKRFFTFALAILVVEALGALGAVFTVSSIPGWYANLAKPPGTPPDWIFGPVWTLLYALMGASWARVWLLSRDTKGRPAALAWFGVQFVLNLAWSPVFFGMRQMLAGLVVIVLLLSAIAMTIRSMARVDRLAAGLLVPYALWVGYATYLNAALWHLNS